MATVQERLNTANPTDIADRLRQVSAGDIIAGLIPVERTRSSLTSQTTHVHDKAAIITVVAVSTTANVIVASTVTPGVGEVAIAYDTDGVPTLTFQAATTEYTVVEQTLPSGLGATLALDG